MWPQLIWLSTNSIIIHRSASDNLAVDSLVLLVWDWVLFPARERKRTLSIQQKIRFEISEIPRAQWNGTFRLNRPHRAFGYCSCKQDTRERYWGQQFCQMERDISVRRIEMTRPIKVDHLLSWSRIFGSDQTFDVQTKISGILGWMESAHSVQSKICELVSGKLSKCLYKHIIVYKKYTAIKFWNQENASSSQRWKTLADLFNECLSLSVSETAS